MSQNEYIFKQHEENVEWTSKLDFFKDEIKILQGRLEEIAGKNNQKDVLIMIEHFQNQLIIYRNTLDEIQHKINIAEDELQQEVKKNPVASDHRKTPYHQNEKEEILIFERVFKEFHDEFNRFASKWL